MSTINFDTSTMHPIGTQFRYRGKAKRVGTVTGYRVIYDTDTDTTKVLYIATHEFMGQTLTDRDVNATTIAMGIAALSELGART